MPGRPARILISAAAALAFAGSAWAFGTVRTLGQNAEHEKITRLALGCGAHGPAPCFQAQTLDDLAGRQGTLGAIGAPDAGTLTFQPKAHCDGGDFLDAPGYPQSAVQARTALEACRAWMKSELELAAKEAGDILDKSGAIRVDQTRLGCSFSGAFRGSAKCKALDDFGASLHAAQDFYAHSNWADLPATGPVSPENPPGLGHDGPAPWLDWRTTTAFPKGLISDCFTGVPETMFCNYGRSARVKHAYINKDTGSIDVDTGKVGAGTTPRGAINGNFARAVRAAEGETQVKWAMLQDAIHQHYGREKGDRIVCALISDTPLKTCH